MPPNNELPANREFLNRFPEGARPAIVRRFYECVRQRDITDPEDVLMAVSTEICIEIEKLRGRELDVAQKRRMLFWGLYLTRLADFRDEALAMARYSLHFVAMPLEMQETVRRASLRCNQLAFLNTAPTDVPTRTQCSRLRFLGCPTFPATSSEASELIRIWEKKAQRPVSPFHKAAMSKAGLPDD